ncbi:hypothetical protein Leryth_021487 [Lithospermum erythrorhizon]|nr:hypothetical protein Leryth_021487 [Lithospermum erythrorhizon]
MNPFSDPNTYHTRQLQQPNGTSSLTPHQVMGPPNPLQMGGGVPNPQFNQFLNNGNGGLGFNIAQQLGQFMPQNSLNPNQIFSQNANLGQWNLPNPMQNMNLGLNTNPFLAMGISPQNLAILASAQFGLMSANQVAHMGMQVQGNLGTTPGIRPPQAQHNNQNYNQAPAQVSLGNVTNNNHTGNWKKTPNKMYSHNHDSFHNRSVNSPFHRGQPGKGNFGLSKDRRGKGHQDEGPRKSIANQSKEKQGVKRRSLVLTYTDQEIKQWREQRRKNYPLQATLQKKLADKTAASEARDEAAKLRRQQLKEILAKQAELGCEVAEIPSSYLCDSEKQVHMEGTNRPFNKKERFQNKFNKRGRFHKNDHFSRRSKSGNCDPSDECQQMDQLNEKQIRGNNKLTRQDGASKKKPTLLQKLLSADIKREKHQLLQVFRFMVMNSFFKDFPEKALKFPPVIIKVADYESPVVEENEVIRGVDVGPSGSVDGVDNEGIQHNHNQENDGPRNHEELPEEEGEIID